MDSNQISTFATVRQKLAKLVCNYNFILCVWVLLAVISTSKQYFNGNYNNYLIFKYAFLNAKDHLNLYLLSTHYLDSNHYGPFFSLLIAPFALLPNFVGMLLWQLANTLFLYFVIKRLPLKHNQIVGVYWIVSHELLTAMFSFQFNSSIVAVIAFSYILIQEKKNFWAAFVIMLGTFVKLYGIVGLAFFFFVKEQPKFIAYCIFWAVVFFVAPMLVFSPGYILQCYQDWYVSLSEKQELNASLTSMQDISVMGMVRRITGNINIPNLPFLAIGLLIFVVPYTRIKQYKSEIFKLFYLASALIFTVIFSNSSESPTYIIAFVGVAIWFVLQEKPVKPTVIALFVFALLLTSFSPSDLFPKFVREEYIRPYSLKALPCILIWLVISYDLLFRKFENTPSITV